MKLKRIVAIDPGKDGGLAFRMTNGNVVVYPMPGLASVDEHELFRILQQYEPEVAVMESVGAIPMASAKTSFSFGYNVGLIRGILGSLGCPVEVVLPKKWQGELWRRWRPQVNDADKAIKADNKLTKIYTYECVKRALPSIDFRKPHARKADSFHDGMTDACGILLWYLHAESQSNAVV